MGRLAPGASSSRHLARRIPFSSASRSESQHGERQGSGTELREHERNSRCRARVDETARVETEAECTGVDEDESWHLQASVETVGGQAANLLGLLIFC